jgi:hypothetical protein
MRWEMLKEKHKNQGKRVRIWHVTLYKTADIWYNTILETTIRKEINICFFITH